MSANPNAPDIEQPKRKKNTPPKNPPFPDAKGKWVRSFHLPHNRNYFGKFRCKSCKNRWTSAFAYVNYKQKCQKCSDWCQPTWMFIFKKTKYNINKKKKREPHKRDLCGACLAGKCAA